MGCKQGVHQPKYVCKRTTYPCGRQMKQVEIHSLEVPMLGSGASTTHAYQRVHKHEIKTRPLGVPMLLASYPELYTIIQK